MNTCQSKFCRTQDPILFSPQSVLSRGFPAVEVFHKMMLPALYPLPPSFIGEN